jgi:AcrR family transcriptional regulator
VPARPTSTGPDRTHAAPAAARPKLTREGVVAAAVALADARGLAAVTIRGVAAELGARPMSLYPQIGSKDDLLDLMLEEIASETVLDVVPNDWRAALRAIAEATRATCLRHPWITIAHGGRPAFGPNRLRHIEQSLAAVDGLDLPLSTVRAVLFAVDTFTLGAITTEIGLTSPARLDDTAWREASADALADPTTASTFPRLAAIGGPAVVVVDIDYTAIFDAGLDWLLDGFAASLDR